MNTDTIQSRELRTALSGSLAYTSGCGEGGHGEWFNISRTGAALTLGRYLRPGRQIHLEHTTDIGESIAIPAEIAWCVPIAGTLHFRAGVKVLRKNPEIALHFATLGYTALAQNKRKLERVTKVVRPASNSTKVALPNAGVTPLTHAV